MKRTGNPTIAGFELRFRAKGKFSSLAKAKQISFRREGLKRWKTLDVSHLRTKAQKENALAEALEAEIEKIIRVRPPRKKRPPPPPPPPELEEEIEEIEEIPPELPKPRKPRKPPAPPKPPKPPKIKFDLIEEDSRRAVTRDDVEIGLITLKYNLHGGPMEFVRAQKLVPHYLEFLEAAKREVIKAFEFFGPHDYFARLQFSDYRNFDYKVPGDDRKGWHGYSTSRFPVSSVADIENHFDSYFRRLLVESFSSYMIHGVGTTEFDISGLMIEIVEDLA